MTSTLYIGSDVQEFILGAHGLLSRMEAALTLGTLGGPPGRLVASGRFPSAGPRH